MAMHGDNNQRRTNLLAGCSAFSEGIHVTDRPAHHITPSTRAAHSIQHHRRPSEVLPYVLSFRGTCSPSSAMYDVDQQQTGGPMKEYETTCIATDCCSWNLPPAARFLPWSSIRARLGVHQLLFIYSHGSGCSVMDCVVICALPFIKASTTLLLLWGILLRWIDLLSLVRQAFVTTEQVGRQCCWIVVGLLTIGRQSCCCCGGGDAKKKRRYIRSLLLQQKLAS